MTNIMGTNKTATVYATAPLTGGGSIVNNNTSSAAFYSNLQKRSLNKESRKRELLKITMENQTILRRLQDKQSNYNINKWEEEAHEKRKILKNICEYPLLEDQKNSTSL